MRQNFLKFTTPSITEAEINAAIEVLKSGWITTGPNAAKLEEEFASYVGAKGAVAVMSATGGMHVLLHLMGIKAGDEVITPSMTWVSTVNLIVLAGAKPVFVDVDKETLMVLPEAIKNAITPRTKLIVPVHFAGAPADLDEIYGIAEKNGIAVIEDAAHAAGTEYKGRKIGAKGTAIFSFHAIKNMTTAEGGMITSNDSDIIERARRIKFHGLGVDAFDRNRQGRSPQAEVLEPGYKYNLTDIAAAIGREQLKRLDIMNERRKQLASLYLERLSTIDEVLPLGFPNYDFKHAWHLFVVRVLTEKIGITREAFMKELEKRNIGTGIHFKAVHLQKYYRDAFGFKQGMLPNTEWNSERICSLPLFPDMREEDVNDVVDAIKDVLRCAR